jgi:filamentous hemagglutinin
MNRTSQRLFILLLIIGLVTLSRWRQAPKPVPGRADSAPAVVSDGSAEPIAVSEDLVVKDVTIRDQQGRIAFQGDVDLRKTLERIDDDRRLSYGNDGSNFQNRERRLPAKSAGHYREWVHPTPDVPGPGPQRIVTGRNGEAYYTPDHYRTFRRIR